MIKDYAPDHRWELTTKDYGDNLYAVSISHGLVDTSKNPDDLGKIKKIVFRTLQPQQRADLATIAREIYRYSYGKDTQSHPDLTESLGVVEYRKLTLRECKNRHKNKATAGLLKG